MSRNDQVPTVRSIARSPQRYSTMRPMKLIPPKLIPNRRSSGPPRLGVPAWALVGTRRAKRIGRILVRDFTRMIEVEYRFSCRGCQAFATALLFGLLSSCAPPDRPQRLPEPLPAAFLAAFQTESLRVLSPGPGVAYYGLAVEEGPWAIHLLAVDLGQCDLGFRVLPAPKQDGMQGGRSRVTELQTVPQRPLAAVNGDFFTPEGLPLGTEVVGGEVRRFRSRPAFAWRPGVPPWMGTPSTEGDTILQLGWRVSRREGDGLSQVVGGFPLLLENGIRVGDLGVVDRPSFAAARHPRTAVGFDTGKGRLWIVVVDGRQPGYSDGMTLPELGGLFETLGVTEAVNLDGGGSTVMVLEGSPVSRPSDAEGERAVVNALGVVRDGGFCRIVGR